MKKLIFVLILISLMGCTLVEKVKTNVKEEVSGYELSVVNTRGSGYVYRDEGKLYYKANDYVEAVEIDVKDIVKYGGKILIR